MDVTRHKSIDTLRGYVRRADSFKDHAGAAVGREQGEEKASLLTKGRLARARPTIQPPIRTVALTNGNHN